MVSKNEGKKSRKELVLMRRKTNSPTIEDDFTVEEEEPWDEPSSTPRAKESKAAAANKQANVDSEFDMICCTESESDGGSRKDQRNKIEDKSKSIHSLVWSGSDLDDVRETDVVDQRDDNAETRDNVESRESSSDVNDKRVDRPVNNNNFHDTVMTEKNIAQVEERAHEQSKGNVKFQIEDEDPFAVRAERSTDSAMDDDHTNEPSYYGCDEQSAFSLTPSMAPSVALSVTKRISNTRGPFVKSPREALSPSLRPISAFHTDYDDADTTAGQSTIMTADVEGGLGANCCQRKDKTRADIKEEDLLDRFFENVESHVCPTPKNGEQKKEVEDGLKSLFNPFLDSLKKFDTVFEHLENVACPEENKKNDGSFKGKKPSTPAAFAAEKFTQLLDSIERFDPDFVQSKAASCRSSCNIYEDDDSTAVSSVKGDEGPSNEESSVNTSPYDILEKAYQRAEAMLKEQKRTNFDQKDQTKKMQEQWFAARLNWKLRQSILTEAVKQNAAKAAETTKECVDTMVASCHPSMASVAKNVDDEKMPRRRAPAHVNTNPYDSESDAYHTASSVDNSDFFSTMTPSDHSNFHSKPVAFRSSILSPSEHSNLDSSRRNFRTIMDNALSEDDTSASFMSNSERLMSNSERVVRSPDCLSPSNADEGPTGALSIITEEAAGGESVSSSNTAKRNDPKKKKPAPPLRRWAYPSPAYYNDNSSSSRYQDMSNPTEWFVNLKNSVETGWGIFDRAQCASESLNFADSNSFEDDNVRKNELQNEFGHAETAERVNQKNSIIEDEDHSVRAIDVPENKYSEDDDMGGFEIAVNAGDSEQDERPPMLRLMQSRNDSKSCESRDGIECNKSKSKGGSFQSGLSMENKSKSNSGSVHSRLSTEQLHDGYTLVDSIRYASLSTRNNEANRTRQVQEPGGNKLKNEPSTHVRSTVPPPIPSKGQKQDPEVKLKDEQKIRSPRSSETHETSDLTVTASSSDVVVTKIANSSHSQRSVPIHIEAPNEKKVMESEEKNSENFVSFNVQKELPVDDDGDKATVTSYNTSSTDEFRDCYQDAIPSLSTMGTVLEDETYPAPERNERKDRITFLSSNENIVKSMALLSVSAAVLKTTQKNSHQAESEEDEVESVPSTSSQSNDELVEDQTTEANSEEAEPKEPLETLHEEPEMPEVDEEEESDTTKDICVKEGVVDGPLMEGSNESSNNLLADCETLGPQDFEEDIVTEEIGEDGGVKLFSKEAQPSNHPAMEEGDIVFKQPPNENEAVSLDELIFQSLKHQDSSEAQPPMDGMMDNDFVEDSIMMKSPELQTLAEGIELKSTSNTKKASSKLREPRSIEDRRRRRLRQRRKFEKVLRGEDDSSLMSSSTMSSGENASRSESNGNVPEHPLISASFDTGFGSVPVIEENH